MKEQPIKVTTTSSKKSIEEAEYAMISHYIKLH